MPQLHETRIGQKFLEGTMPRIADALTDIAVNMGKRTKAGLDQDNPAVGVDGQKLVINSFVPELDELGMKSDYPLISMGWCQDLCNFIKKCKRGADDDAGKIDKIREILAEAAKGGPAQFNDTACEILAVIGDRDDRAD